MIETCKELLYREIGKYAVEAMDNINFDELVNKAAIRALREIQDVILDDNIGEEAKAPFIESVLLKYGLEITDYYD